MKRVRCWGRNLPSLDWKWRGETGPMPPRATVHGPPPHSDLIWSTRRGSKHTVSANKPQQLYTNCFLRKAPAVRPESTPRQTFSGPERRPGSDVDHRIQAPPLPEHPSGIHTVRRNDTPLRSRRLAVAIRRSVPRRAASPSRIPYTAFRENERLSAARRFESSGGSVWN